MASCVSVSRASYWARVIAAIPGRGGAQEFHVDTDADNRNLPALTQRLQRFAASAELTSSKALIVIDCADDAVQQRFIDVLNACQKAGLRHISLAQ